MSTPPIRILLIAPASGNWRQVGRSRWFNGRTFRFSLLSLLSVAAETPAGAEVRLVDEQIEAVPFDAPVDLVGITCMTALAPRAYEIAAQFRRRRVPVVLGGFHPSLCPDEALRHADAVVVGDAEGLWPQVVEAARAGRLSGVFRHATAPDLAGLKRPPRHLLAGRRYATVHAVQATRGCPHHCDFCSVAAFHDRSHRRRPVTEVVAEVAEFQERFFIFVDDNLTADRDYARQLFAALRPLNKRWVTQCTLALADDTELLSLAAKAGCIGVFVGLETFSAGNLSSVGKESHRVEQCQDALRRFHRQGIAVEAGIVFGFPHDTPAVFSETLRRLDELQVDAIQVSVFTPLPGTPRFAMMQDRILDRNWAHYDFHHAVFTPWAMSAESLQAGHDWVTREFFRPGRILRRVRRHLRRPRAWESLPYVLAVNLAYYGRVLRWHIRGWNPAESATATQRPSWLDLAKAAWARLRPASATTYRTG